MEMFLCIGRAIHSVSAFQRKRITRSWRDIAHFAQLWTRPSSGRACSLLLSAHRRQPQTDRTGFGKWNLRILPLQFYFANLTTEAGRPGHDRYSVQCSLTGNHLNNEHVRYLDYRPKSAIKIVVYSDLKLKKIFASIEWPSVALCK